MSPEFSDFPKKRWVATWESKNVRKQLNIRFSEDLKKHINRQKKDLPIKRPIAAILFASSDGGDEKLTLGFYDIDDLPSIKEFQIFDCDGVAFLFPQSQNHDELDGCMLGIMNGNIIVSQ